MNPKLSDVQYYITPKDLQVRINDIIVSPLRSRQNISWLDA